MVASCCGELLASFQCQIGFQWFLEMIDCQMPWARTPRRRWEIQLNVTPYLLVFSSHLVGEVPKLFWHIECLMPLCHICQLNRRCRLTEYLNCATQIQCAIQASTSTAWDPQFSSVHFRSSSHSWCVWLFDFKPGCHVSRALSLSFDSLSLDSCVIVFEFDVIHHVIFFWVWYLSFDSIHDVIFFWVWFKIILCHVIHWKLKLWFTSFVILMIVLWVSGGSVIRQRFSGKLFWFKTYNYFGSLKAICSHGNGTDCGWGY